MRWACAGVVIMTGMLTGTVLADETSRGRTLEEALREQPIDRTALAQVRVLLGRYDTTGEEAVRRLLSRKIALLVRRNLPLFTKTARGTDPERHTAIRALAIAAAPGTVELMLRILESPITGAQLDALEALGELRDIRATPAVLSRLRSRDPVVRATACRALGRIGDRRAVEPLLHLLRSETHTSVRVAAVAALGLMRATEAKTLLEGLLANRLVPAELKEACRKALTEISRPEPDFKLLPPPSVENTLPIIAEQMDLIERRLEYYWSGKRTQHRQEQVVKALDQLIRMLEQQQQQQGGGSGSGQGSGEQNQGSQSGSRSGSSGASPATADTPTNARAGGDREHKRSRALGLHWGNLPPAVRAEIEQALREKLPERYRRLLESYTRALAESAGAGR